MPLGSLIKLGLALWVGAEIFVFVMVAKLIGVPVALLLGLLTTIFGWTMLKRAGASAMVKLRAALNGRHVAEGSHRDVLDDTLASLGAFALLVPGFLSDIAGLVLAISAARVRLTHWIEASRLGRSLRRNWLGPDFGPTTIDLNPADWKNTSPSREPASRS